MKQILTKLTFKVGSSSKIQASSKNFNASVDICPNYEIPYPVQLGTREDGLDPATKAFEKHVQSTTTFSPILALRPIPISTNLKQQQSPQTTPRKNVGAKRKIDEEQNPTISKKVLCKLCKDDVDHETQEDLKLHWIHTHFKKDLRSFYGSQTKCQLCSMIMPNEEEFEVLKAIHVGSVHPATLEELYEKAEKALNTLTMIQTPSKKARIKGGTPKKSRNSEDLKLITTSNLTPQKTPQKSPRKSPVKQFKEDFKMMKQKSILNYFGNNSNNKMSS